ncbi:MAG: NAD(P)H-dependent oxidoreductase [Alphaproteobacteria bacterium]|nr:NAD(P)H-dependent oxidoreductase [Alphaproteobacteria bacterium]
MKKSLVAYFSATETTRGLAEKLAGAIGADLFEIEPREKYSAADLDWTDKTSRSTTEMNNRACRPAIAKKIQNFSDYDVIFVGFPIWWYREPSIIDTFMESYDFAGKTIVPFATSGGSPIGDAYKNMQKLAPDATVERGTRFDTGIAPDKLKKWAENWM